MPVRVTSPVAPVEASHPPSSWRFSGNDTNDGSASPQASRSTDINLPILGSVLTPLKQNNLSADVRAAGLTAPRRAAPPPPEQPADTPSEKNVEVIFTPPSEQLSRQSSAAQNGPLPLDEDPDVRRDFAARIAAATAALNRTPSLSKSARLERKPSRRGPMVISNPTLTSSSARILSTPLTPPEQAMDPDMAKALEKTSGSTRKMSAKWRKFGFKKGPSISEDEVVALPSPAIPMTPKSATSLDKLDVPISLRPAESNPPTFNTFRFPPKSASTAMDEARQAERAPPGTRKKILGAANRSLPGGQDSSASRLTESTTRAKVGQKASDADPATIFPDAQHSPTPSDVSVVASFIEAGRALGLNNDQLNEMLAQKGMLDRSGTSFSSKSYKSTANTSTIFSHPSPSPASLDLCRMPSIGKDKRGLFRSLSKGKKTTRRPTPPGVVEPGSRDVLVRRTLLIPSEPAAGASVTPQLRPSPTGDPASGTLSPSDRHVVQRNPSIKRKPVRLSAEDQELVSGTPPLHKRNPSSSSAASGQSENETEPVALGFLHRKAQLGRSTSSARSDAPSDQGSTGGGSLYDLYNHDSNGGLEVLQSPSKEGERRASEQTNGSARAVEIR